MNKYNFKLIEKKTGKIYDRGVLSAYTKREGIAYVKRQLNEEGRKELKIELERVKKWE